MIFASHFHFLSFQLKRCIKTPLKVAAVCAHKISNKKGCPTKRHPSKQHGIKGLQV